MCYDISFTVNIRVLSEYFPDLIYDDQIEIDFDKGVHIMAPGLYNEHGVIYRHREDRLPHLRLMEWGIIPFTIDDTEKLKEFSKGRTKWANARAERIWGDKKSYWFKIKDRRCLIPLTATYEHREVKGWKKKVPYLIWLCDQKVFFVPGLYSVAQIVDKKTGEVTTRRTMAMITRPANFVMKNIHNSGDNPYRMPLFLPFDMANHFINHDLPEKEYKEILNFEMPSEKLVFHTTDTIRTQKFRDDGLPKNAKFEWPNLPPLGQANPDLKIKQ